MEKEFIRTEIERNKLGNIVINMDKKLLISIIEESVLFHFRNLGNNLGDCLSVTEMWNGAIEKVIEERRDCDLQNIDIANEINIDELAAALDDILKFHVLSILSDCRALLNNSGI